MGGCENCVWVIDWQAVAIFGGAVLNAVAIIGAAWWATHTARDFFSQRAAQRMGELSEQTLTLAYKSSDIFSDLRNPLSLTPIEDLELKHSDKVANELQRRIDRNNDYFKNCYDIGPSIKAYFGKDVFDNFRRILKLRSNYQSSASMYISLLIDQTNGNFGEEERNLIKQARKDLYEYDKDDKIKQELAEIEAFLEDRLMRYIKPKL